MQPSASIAAVPNEYSSAPSSAASSTSRPVLNPPSTRTRTRSRRPFSMSVACVSASPSSHGQAGVLDRRQRRRARAAVGARDLHDVGERLRDAGGDRADVVLGDELHRDLRLRVDLLEVVDELREILDRVDVVVRRGRDQSDAGLREPQPRDLAAHLVAGQLAAFAGLRALRDLDVELVGERAVLGRDAEAPRRDLLDPRVAVARGATRAEARGVLAALAAVALPADHVHGDRQRLVRLRRQRAVRHRARREPARDRLDAARPRRAGSGSPAGTSSRRSCSSVDGALLHELAEPLVEVGALAIADRRSAAGARRASRPGRPAAAARPGHPRRR